MRIAMFTNTYLPHVGGVARSVDRFTRGCRREGHNVLVVAPQYEGARESDDQVHRVPAVSKLNGSDFSLALPVDTDLRESIKRFEPELIHSHHPFLLGNTAVRVSAEMGLPLLFTHHTMYEHYTHYVPMELEAMKTYVMHLATGYADLADRALAPSESTARIMKHRGVSVPIDIVPTGVDVEEYREGDAKACREKLDIPADAPLIGHVGRLAEEKNISLLAEACAKALQEDSRRRLLVVGDGESRDRMHKILAKRGTADRAVFAGTLQGKDLVDAYHAMDVFAFASRTETQGMVLTEACGAGCPVVAVDAPGAREVVQDAKNGRLVASESPDDLAEAIGWVLQAKPDLREQLARTARQTAEAFSARTCLQRLLDAYRRALDAKPKPKDTQSENWKRLIHRLGEEWKLWSNRMQSAVSALEDRPPTQEAHPTPPGPNAPSDKPSSQ